jgi:hypothetical protein
MAPTCSAPLDPSENFRVCIGVVAEQFHASGPPTSLHLAAPHFQRRAVVVGALENRGVEELLHQLAPIIRVRDLTERIDEACFKRARREVPLLGESIAEAAEIAVQGGVQALGSETDHVLI